MEPATQTESASERDYLGTATYSPDDNKLRLSPFTRLSKSDYDRVKSAGFSWAPKQELFVAGMWTPEREDLLIELCGEIEDEDVTPEERASDRAERFDGYSDKRARDAEQARAGVARLADHIPLGQPILIGHHSEKRARKDAERIQDGMRRTVKMWETSEYWKHRAAASLAHASYLQLPAVRERRIKTIEADLRKVERSLQKNRDEHALWASIKSHEQAYHVAGLVWVNCIRRADGDGYWTAYDVLRPDGERFSACPAVAWDEVRERVLRSLDSYPPRAQRWINHYQNRLAYERAMLAADGGSACDKWKLEVGGQILRRGKWFRIVRVNAASVSVRGHFATTVTFDEITDYQAPTPEETEKVKAATKLPPLCNYPGDGFRHMTYAELMGQHCRRWSDFQKTGYRAATDTHGAHRVQQCRSEESRWKTVGVFITDKPRKDPPAKNPDAPTLPAPTQAAPQPRYAAPKSEAASEIAAIKATLAAGVQVISAPQLFPTPPELARRMVQDAGIEPGMCVLEPSAGTGNLVRAVLDEVDTEVLAYEINAALCAKLSSTFPSYKLQVRCKDFLTVTDFAGCYPRIIMNPPFANGDDIKHIRHALTMLAPGGRIVAICADGPRQREQLRPLAENSGGWYEPLPAGTFAEQGTGVNTALLLIEG